MLEGSCKYGMVLILDHIIGQRILDLDSINSRIQSFPFQSNRPSLIKASYMLRNDLPFSATEMKNLVLYFSLIVGDMMPCDDLVWEYYLVLQDLLNLFLLNTMSECIRDHIDVLVTRHNELYLAVFETSLKPKMHHLLHYKRCILKFGEI